VDQFGNQVFRDALVVSLKTSLIAHVAVLVFGTPTAYLIARKRFVGRSALITLVELPLVMPPAVAGIALLAAFGRFGLLGDQLNALGIQIGFTQAAVILAVAFVESPFYLRGAIAAFESVDENLVSAARTLGAGPWRVFGRIALPLAAGGLGAASSGRRSSSRAACRASRRRSRSRSTRSSTRTSTSHSRSARSSSSSGRRYSSASRSSHGHGSARSQGSDS
jgi:ABC-type sulfate transport system permease component